jgi:hypothetical protein
MTAREGVLPGCDGDSEIQRLLDHNAKGVPELGLGDQQAAEALIVALRALVVAAAPRDVVQAVAGFVLALDGRLVPAAAAVGTELPIDIAFGVFAPILVDADGGGICRMRLERLLPVLLEDARHVMSGLRQSTDRGSTA